MISTHAIRSIRRTSLISLAVGAFHHAICSWNRTSVTEMIGILAASSAVKQARPLSVGTWPT